VNVADKMGTQKVFFFFFFGTQKVFLSRWDGRDSVAELCAYCCTWMTKPFFFFVYIFLLAKDKKNTTYIFLPSACSWEKYVSLWATEVAVSFCPFKS
jgi:hypothetical protein